MKEIIKALSEINIKEKTEIKYSKNFILKIFVLKIFFINIFFWII